MSAASPLTTLYGQPSKASSVPALLVTGLLDLVTRVKFLGEYQIMPSHALVLPTLSHKPRPLQYEKTIDLDPSGS